MLKSADQGLLMPKEALVHLVGAERVELRANRDFFKDDLISRQLWQKRVPFLGDGVLRIGDTDCLMPFVGDLELVSQVRLAAFVRTVSIQAEAELGDFQCRNAFGDG